MPPIDWGKLFIFTVSPVELFIRGTIVYLVIFVLMRVFRREAGTVGIADLLMVVLIADASQNASVIPRQDSSNKKTDESDEDRKLA